ncbi:hypothetical protein [Streptomyces globisporus]|uniref:hypothetical protein n=1 Tax=Streptomyces globisporus TaxID=1908 RepID=UPI002F909FEA|nr:hypothetical protein OG449_34550 [Streptomyces globisporus]
MTPAVAALLGSIVGGVFVGVPALLSAYWARQNHKMQLEAQIDQVRLQIKAQALEQRREPRSQHYADFVNGIDVLAEYLSDHWLGTHMSPDVDVLATNLEEVLRQERMLHRNWSRVAIEGTEAVANSGLEVLETVSQISGSLRVDLRGRRADPPEDVTPRRTRQNFWRAMNDAQESFISVARRSLQDDGTRKPRRSAARISD